MRRRQSGEAKLIRRRRAGEVGGTKKARQSWRGGSFDEWASLFLLALLFEKGHHSKFSISIIFPSRAQTSKMNARVGKPDWLKIKLVSRKKLVLQNSYCNHRIGFQCYDCNMSSAKRVFFSRRALFLANQVYLHVHSFLMFARKK